MSTLDDDLTATLGPDEPEQQPDETVADYQARLDQWRTAWEARDLADADWCARRYRQAQARLGEIYTLAARRIAEIQEWAAAQEARIQPDVDYFEGRLIAFHRARREQDPKHAKTIGLPSGVELRSSAGRVKVEIDDAVAALGWLLEHEPECVVYADPSIAKAEIAARFGGKAKQEKAPGSYPAVSSDGEVVPGVSLVRGDVSYTVS